MLDTAVNRISDGQGLSGKLIDVHADNAPLGAQSMHGQSAWHCLPQHPPASLCSCGDKCDLHHSVHRGKLVPYPVLHQILRRWDQGGAVASLQCEVANVIWASREDRNSAVARLLGAGTL